MIDVYVLGQGNFFADVFNAVSMMVGDNMYEYLQRMAVAFSGVFMVFSMIRRSHIGIPIAWLGKYMVVVTALLAPTASVAIHDSQKNDMIVRTVDHVPMGLAALASLSSRIGYGLTTLTEKIFAVPGDVLYSKTGRMFGSKVLDAMGHFRLTDAKLSKNLDSFAHQCVFYDIAFGKYSMQDLTNSSDAWALVTKNPSPTRMFLYDGNITTCKDGAPKLTNDWTQTLAQSQTRYGQRLLSMWDSNSKTDDEAKNQLLSRLSDGYEYFTGVSQEASLLMRQSMLSHALSQGFQPHSQAAMASLAQIKAMNSKRFAGFITGQMMSYWLPIANLYMKAILYGLFPIVALLAMVLGANILFQYAKSLFWLELWAPVFAVVNMGWSTYAHNAMPGKLAGTGSSSFVALYHFATVNTDLASYAGWCTVLVPFIAAGLFKGLMETFVHASQVFSGNTQGFVKPPVDEALSSNLSMQNTSFANQNAFNHGMFHDNINPSLMTAGIVTGQYGTGATFASGAHGHMVVNTQPAISNLGTNMYTGHTLNHAFTRSSEHAMGAGRQDMVGYSEQSTAGLRGVADMGYGLNHHTSSGDSWGLNDSSRSGDAAQQVDRLIEQAQHHFGVSRDEAIKKVQSLHHSLEAHAGIGGNSGIFNAGASVSIGHKGETSRDTGNSISERDAKDLQWAQDHHVSSVIDNAKQAIHDEQYQNRNEKFQKFAQDVNSHFDKADSYRSDAQAHFSEAQHYRALASKAESESANINTQYSQELLEWTVSSGRARDYNEAQHTFSSQPGRAQAWAEDFVAAHREQMMGDFEKAHPVSDKAVHQQWDNKQREISSLHAQVDMNAIHQTQAVQAMKQQASFAPVNDGIVKEAASEMQANQSSIDGSQQSIDQRHQDMQNRLHEEKDAIHQQVHKNIIKTASDDFFGRDGGVVGPSENSDLPKGVQKDES